MTERFGRYQLLAPLGSGGMAEVFRARLELPGGAEKILVIKRIRPSLHEEPSFLRLFVDEARIALPLSHDNITSVFEFGEVDGQYFLAMEYIHGQTLAAVLRQAREGLGPKLPLSLALFIASEVAKGLSYAHNFRSAEGEPREVIHLDVSPQNILLSYDGAVKLTDFGIARVLGDLADGGRARGAPPSRGATKHDARADGATGNGAMEPGATKEERLLGKASYLAPEQVRRGPVDARTDVYALGCVLYECLVGTPPHGRGGDREVMERVHTGLFKPPSETSKALAPFDPLLARALAADPSKRYPSAEALHADLAKTLFSLAPGTDAPQLAAWLRQAFADELLPNGKSSERRAHILQQLDAAGFQPSAQNTTELLDSDTIALPGLPERPKKERRRRGRLIALGLGASLTVAGLVTAAAIRAQPPLTEDPAPPPTAQSSVSLHSFPAALVSIGGVEQAGRTPMEIKLAAGTHSIVFTHPELDLRKEVELELLPGSERTVVVTLGR